MRDNVGGLMQGLHYFYFVFFQALLLIGLSKELSKKLDWKYCLVIVVQTAILFKS